jgi:predicted MPP superfamily phosphohydrolase
MSAARPRMSRFLRALIGITLVIHVPVVVAAAEAARRLHLPWPWVIGAAYAAIGMLLFVGRARAGMPDHRRTPRMVWLVDVPYFVHWCACVWTLVPSVVYTIVAPIAGELSAGFYLWTYASGLLVAAYGVLVRRRWFVVRNVEVPVSGLDARLDGYRIVHLSDLHIGSATPKSWGERWVRAANEAAADLAVVTGDMVTSGTEFHEDIADVLGRLTARDGVVVSMGNHDYFGDGEPLMTMLRAGGAKVLRNEGMLVSKGDARMFVAAIDDTWTRRADLPRALAGRPEGATTVLLAHDPDQFPRAVERGVELVLSGHTHGGQVAVPFLGRWLSLSHLSHRFHVGLYRIGRSALFVHPGLGTTGPPIRLGVAPAVCVLTLRAA